MCLHIFECKWLNPIKKSLGTDPVDCFSRKLWCGCQCNPWGQLQLSTRSASSATVMLRLSFWVCDNITRKILNTSKQSLLVCHTITKPRLEKKKKSCVPVAVFLRCFSDIDPPFHSSLDLFTLLRWIKGACPNQSRRLLEQWKDDQDCSGEFIFNEVCFTMMKLSVSTNGVCYHTGLRCRDGSSCRDC